MPAALLLLDFQAGVVETFGSPEVIASTRTALDAARQHDIPVIYVRLGFRHGAPEVSQQNKSFSSLAGAGGPNAMGSMGTDDPSTQVVEALAPVAGDVVVLKRRVSAFTGSDLEVVLRALGVDHLVLTGIATSGVVLSTLCEAADRDFRLTVLADACTDGDDEVHRVLTEKVFPRQADVTMVGAWIAALG